MKSGALIFVCGVLFLGIGAQADVISEKVHAQTQLECFVNGASLGAKQFESDIVVRLQTSPDETTAYGAGIETLDYANPAEIHIQAIKNEDASAAFPGKWQMTFTTFVKVYNGASWGHTSSTVYFDSFRNFSPVEQRGLIYTSEDERDLCQITTVVSPVLVQ